MINKDLLIYYSGKAIPSLANILIIVLGIRWLGESGYGSFNLIYNAALVAASLCMGWLQQSSLRFVSGQQNNELAEQYYTLGLWSSSISFLVTFIFCVVYFNLEITLALAAGLFSALWIILSVHLTLLQSKFSSLSFAITESSYNLLIVALLATLLYLGMSASILVFFLIFCSSILVTLIVSMLRGKWKFEIRKIPTSALQQALKFGFPLTVWLLIANLFNITDRYMISYYLGDVQTGVYSSVYDLIYKLAALGCFPILLSRHPAIAAAWNNKSFSEVIQLIRKSILLQTLVLGLMLTGGIFLGEWLIQFFLKIKIESYYLLSIPLILSSVLWQMAMLIQKPLEMSHKSLRMILNIVVCLLLNCTLNMIFIPRFGIIAASFTTLTSTLLYIFVSLFDARKILKKTHELA
ncbi:N/A [soil metagenome]